jgi:hypothetical protein
LSYPKVYGADTIKNVYSSVVAYLTEVNNSNMSGDLVKTITSIVPKGTELLVIFEQTLKTDEEKFPWQKFTNILNQALNSDS